MGKAFCPNCGETAEREGKEISCANCDCVFTITKTGGAKVQKIGRVESIEHRLDTLESMIGDPDPEQVPDEDPPADPGSHDEEPENENEDW